MVGWVVFNGSAFVGRVYVVRCLLCRPVWASLCMLFYYFIVHVFIYISLYCFGAGAFRSRPSCRCSLGASVPGGVVYFSPISLSPACSGEVVTGSGLVPVLSGVLPLLGCIPGR